jgi:hypothetical protein
MRLRMGLVALMCAIGLWAGSDLLACGDKFLNVGRGTRYQRPKNARAASILIYANPSGGLTAALKGVPVESVLKREGHRSTTVQTPEQLSAILAGGRFDVVIVASGDAAAVEKLLGNDPDAAAVLAFCLKSDREPSSTALEPVSCLKSPPREWSLLEAIDKAVEQRDQEIRKAQTRS